MTLQTFRDETPIRLSALVELESDQGETRTLFIGPREGGMKLQLQGREVMVITAASPLGAQLIGKCAGEVVMIGGREFEITSVS
jgi:transcription elongation GreA/GreB family factor